VSDNLFALRSRLRETIAQDYADYRRWIRRLDVLRRAKGKLWGE
jgi:hypothetical protein